MNTISAPNMTQPDTDISVPSTCSGLTKPTNDPSDHLSSPAHSTVSPGENNVVLTRSDQTSSVDPTEQGKAEDEPDVEQKQQTEVDESRGVVNDGKPTLTKSDDTRGECDTDERAEEGQRSLSHK
ncbi:hypothetical protein JOB18_043505 [Solea senegalensis]|uniref:Uncharacterized protein n=2 Tax=Solea senegalensis TaxID=28829 RepID=A0AAV6Q5A9_SOLSE|nr:hypothetical protein JOB18_043505 [Solea senegalensis]